MAEAIAGLQGTEVKPETQAEVSSVDALVPANTYTDTTNMTTEQAVTMNTPMESVDAKAKDNAVGALAIPETEDTKAETPKNITNVDAIEGFGMAKPTNKVVDKPKESVVADPAKATDPLTQKADELYTAQKKKFVADTTVQNQSQRDYLNQKMNQDGYSGSGTKYAMMAVLASSQGRSVDSGLLDLQMKQIDTEFDIETMQYNADQAEKADIRTYNMANFEELTGRPDEQVKFAKMMAELYPEDQYWSLFNNEDYVKSFRTGQEEEVLLRKTKAREAGQTFLDMNTDALYDDDYAKAIFPEWKSIVFGNVEELTINASSWGKSVPLADVNRLLTSMGEAPVNSISEITDYEKLNDLYAMSIYNKAKQDATVLDISERAPSILEEFGLDGNISETERAFISQYTSYFTEAMTANGASMFGVSGNFGSDPETSDFGFMFTDWFGEPYDGNYSREDVNRSQTSGDTNAIINRNLDNLWTAYLKYRDPETPSMTRAEFKAEATKEGSDLGKLAFNTSAISKLSADTAMSNYSQKVDSEKALMGAVSSNLYEAISTGNAQGKAKALTSATSADLASLVNTEQGNKMISDLAKNGDIPSMNSLSDKFDYLNFAKIGEDGKFYMSEVVYIGGELYKVASPLKDTKYNHIGIVGKDGTAELKKFKNSHSEVSNVVNFLNTFPPATTENLLNKYGSLEAIYKAFRDYSGKTNRGNKSVVNNEILAGIQ